MPDLPNKRYLRRGVICKCFGMDDAVTVPLVTGAAIMVRFVMLTSG